MTAPPLAWTVAQAAKELQISEAHLYRLCRDKRVPHFRVGQSIRFSPDALHKWVSERQLKAVR